MSTFKHVTSSLIQILQKRLIVGCSSTDLMHARAYKSNHI
uniref:Uncharacterized protein n=1 Tax=Arundo donax TaxID=35708 RepID=A0A0A9G0N7_ARUDO